MSVNVTFEKDGSLPNTASLQRVLNNLADAIANLSGGVIGSPFTIAGPNNNMVLSGSSTGNDITVTATGTDANIGIQLIPKGQASINIFPRVPDVASAGMLAVTVVMDTTPSGTQNLGVSTGALFECDSNIPTGKTQDGARGINAQVNLNTAGTLTEAQAIFASVASQSTGNIGTAYGMKTWMYDVSSTTDTGSAYAYYVLWKNGVKMHNAFGLWVSDNETNNSGATNHYSLWSDTTGVFRIKADNTFDSVYQSIPALYNPQFTKYTPGAADFERVVLAQWTGNIAQITTEKGGTGTLRGMQIGASTSVPLGFYGKTPIACAVLATGAGHSVDDVITALQNLGLVKQS